MTVGNELEAEVRNAYLHQGVLSHREQVAGHLNLVVRDSVTHSFFSATLDSLNFRVVSPIPLTVKSVSDAGPPEAAFRG